MNKQVRLLESELSVFQKKQKKSREYYVRKFQSGSESDSSSSSVFSSNASSRTHYPPVRTETTCFISPPPLSVTSASEPLTAASPTQAISFSDPDQFTSQSSSKSQNETDKTQQDDSNF